MIAGMPPAPDRDRAHLSRRGALALGASAVAALGLSACGIRLEDDAPRVPGIPTREPFAWEGFLVALWRRSDTLAQRARSVGGPATGVPARLVALHETQATVLRAELARLGVPERVLAEAEQPSPTGTSTTPSSTATSGTATASPSASSPPVGATGKAGQAALAGAEASDLGPTAIASLAQLPADAVPLVGAVLGQRGAAAALLGHAITWPDQALSAPSLAASYLSTTRAAVYGLEVATAQSPAGAQRTLAQATLTALRTRASDQEVLAGSSADPPAVAYTLPFAVTTPAAARKLAVQVLTELRAAIARDLGSARGNVPALGLLVQWLSDTEVLASRWGVPLAPFPGLTTPK